MQRFAFSAMVGLLPALMLGVNPVSTASTGAEATAKAATQPGSYCPGMSSMHQILEELTVAAQGVSEARESLLVMDDAPTADILLARANTALALAAGRGSGARAATLINAVLAAKEDGNPKATLLWFPMIKLTLSSLPDDATRKAANTQLNRAEAILEGQAEGDEIQVLVKARELLECDPLHIPLRGALSRLARLHRAIISGAKPSADDFSLLIDLLKSAMRYGLQRLVDLEQE